MAQRLDLQALLVALLGSPNVYFQPPENIQMQYPCIVYNRDNMDIRHADNSPYKHKTRYQVTYIDRDPDSDVPKKIAELPTSSFSRSFVSEGLNHDVYTLFF